MTTAFDSTLPQSPVRARDLGIPFDGTPGLLNAITDIPGVEVGHCTIVEGAGALQVGNGPVRTGVTAVLPRGRASNDPVFAGWFALNGNGEMTGAAWIEESGFLESPVLLTNTSSVGVARDAAIAWQLRQYGRLVQPWALPVVAETWDGRLNDIHGFHVRPEHVFAALDAARGGRVPEGNAGGGTGMVCFDFKGGIGTASRALSEQTGGYGLGVLVQANFGSRRQLRIAGVPVGLDLSEDQIHPEETGSVIVLIATSAPLLPHQLKRLARRASLGLARTGSVSGNGSGDLFLAFSTANPGAAATAAPVRVAMLPNDRISPLFEAAVEATEEAVINALVAAETMTGIDNRTISALPHAALRRILAQYNRLAG